MQLGKYLHDKGYFLVLIGAGRVRFFSDLRVGSIFSPFQSNPEQQELSWPAMKQHGQLSDLPKFPDFFFFSYPGQKTLRQKMRKEGICNLINMLAGQK